MPEVKELGKMTVRSDDGQHVEVIVLLSVLNVPECEVKRYLDEEFGETNCRHAYDCCGNFYCNGYRILDATDWRMVVQATWAQNV